MQLLSLHASRMLVALLAAACLLPAIGCGPSEAQLNQSTDQMQHLIRAIQLYHAQNMKWPDKLADAAPMIGKDDAIGVIGGAKGFATLMKNPVTNDDPGYEYVKPADMTKLEGTVVLYQLRGGKRDTSLKVGFLDGGVGMEGK